MIVLLICVTLVMMACLFVQGLTIVLAIKWTRTVVRGPKHRRTLSHGFAVVSQIMLLLMAGIVAQITLWAIFYRFLDIIETIETFEKALYFSGVTFTSLGYGDVVLPPGYRLISVLEAATGLLMFGITTAVLVSLMTNFRSYLGRRTDDSDGRH